MKNKTLLCKLTFEGNGANLKPKAFNIFIHGKVNPPSLLRAWHRLDRLRTDNLETDCQLYKKYGQGDVSLFIAANQNLLNATMQCEAEKTDPNLAFNSKAEQKAAFWLVDRLLVSARIQEGYKPF
jgi:hypothetical protein